MSFLIFYLYTYMLSVLNYIQWYQNSECSVPYRKKLFLKMFTFLSPIYECGLGYHVASCMCSTNEITKVLGFSM